MFMVHTLYKLCVRGRLTISDCDGLHFTPRGQKERGLLALLAFAPEKTRSRVWLCDKLWSDRPQDQAFASLRRCLCNIRQSAGNHADFIVGSRNDISLANTVTVDEGDPDKTDLLLLEDLHVKDPEFDDWLRSIRQIDDPDKPPKLLPIPQQIIRSDTPEVEIRLIEVLRPTGSEETFLQSFLTDNLSAQMMSQGDGLNITRYAYGAPVPDTKQGTIDVSVESLNTQGIWRVNLRATTGPSRAFLWSGALSLEMHFETICSGPKMGAFVAQAVSSIFHAYLRQRDKIQTPFMQLQSAIARLYSGRASDIGQALTDLDQLPDAGIHYAWRAYGRLTHILELADRDPHLIEEAEALARIALAKAPDNPVIKALAAQIFLKLSGDPDYGIYLADQAFMLREQDPYVLHSLSQARFFQSDRRASLRMAHLARENAIMLPHAFVWDMQSALSEIGQHNITDAKALALKAHMKMPTYRPAIRYLTIIALLENDMKALNQYTVRLRQLEPGFEIKHLLDPLYPVQTLRMTGLHNELRV